MGAEEPQLAEPERRADGESPSLPRAVWTAVSTDEVAGRVLVTAAVALAVGWLGVKAAVTAVVVVQVLTEALKAVLARLQLSRRRKWLLTLLLFLLQSPQHAFAAVRRVLRRGVHAARHSPLTGVPGAAVTSLAAIVLGAVLVTVPELALGHSLVGDGRTTLFGPRAAPALDLPAPSPVEATSAAGASVTYSVTSAGGVRCDPPSGSAFPLGTTTVVCTARSGGARRSGSFTVTVLDSTAPELSVPGDVERAIAADAEPIRYEVAARDAVDARPAVVCAPASGTRFPLGTTRVSCTATDAAGNAAEASFAVRLTRAQAGTPVLTLPTGRAVEATGPRGAAVAFRATATGPGGRPVAIECDPPSGSLFALGTTRVTCRAGATARSVFDVAVADRTPPELRLPARIERATTGDGVVVTYVAAARDAVDSRPRLSCSPASGTSFAVGETTVSCTAADAAGNTSDGSFVVAVRAETPGAPTIVVPADRIVEAVGPHGAEVEFRVTAADGAGTPLDADCTPRSGSVFPLATTTVGCRAIAADGREATATFDVTVRDTTPPALEVSGPRRVEAASRDGAVVRYETQATDLVTATPTRTCTRASGAVFPVGETTVTCTATDEAGNASPRREFTVTVYDGEPTIATPTDVTVDYATPKATPVRYPPPAARDRVDGPLTPRCTPAPGSSFALGPTTVTCSATDSRGQTAEASFTVTVVDRVKPSLTLPADMTLWAPYGATAFPVTYSAAAADTVDGRLRVACDRPSGSSFPVEKTTLVTCAASDRAGNKATGSFRVTVSESVG